MEYVLRKDSSDFDRRQIKEHQTMPYTSVWFSVIDRSIFTFFSKESIECIIYIKNIINFAKDRNYSHQFNTGHNNNT